MTTEELFSSTAATTWKRGADYIDKLLSAIGDE